MPATPELLETPAPDDLVHIQDVSATQKTKVVKFVWFQQDLWDEIGDVYTALAAKESSDNKGVAGGYASLDGAGKVPASQLPPASSGSANIGVGVVDFGAFPGGPDASLVVTGQAGILSGSVVVAQIRVADSADHAADEHWVEEIDVFAGNIVPGTGFTIYAKSRGDDLSGQFNVQWNWS